MKRNSFMGRKMLLGICTMVLTACSSGGSGDNSAVNVVENVDAEATQDNNSDTELIQDNNNDAETIQDNNDAELMSDNNSVSETDSDNASDKECRCEYPYQHDYAEYLNDLDFYQGIYIGDINDDEIPEMIIDINDYGSYQLLYYTEDGVQMLDLETVSAWGAVTWIADTKQFIYCPFFGHTTGTWGYIEYYVFDWNGTEYEQTFSMLRESGYYVDENNNEYGKCYINDEETDAATFEEKLEEIEKLVQENNRLSEAFPIVHIDDENFENYVRENLPCFRD